MNKNNKKKKWFSFWFSRDRKKDSDESSVRVNTEPEYADGIPEGYCSLDELALKDFSFRSFRVAIDAAIHLTDLFAEMHAEGGTAKPFSPDELWINTENGEIIWKQSENAGADMKKNMRYCAPEVLSEQSDLGTCSDRYLMGIVIFQLLTGGQHPLEGKGAIKPVMTQEMKESLYVVNPQFMFDEGNDENGPSLKIHKDAIAVWDSAPEFIKELCKISFGGKGLNNPEERPSEQEWKAALIKYQNGIIPCTCGHIMFNNDSQEYCCPECGQTLLIDYQIELLDVRIPAVRGNRVYSCQIDPANQRKTQIIARIVASQKDIHKLGIQNLTNDTWQASSTKNEIKTVDPEGIVPLKEGIEFQYNSINAAITRIKRDAGEE